MMIPFNKPYYSGKEMSQIAAAIRSGTLTGDQEIIRLCESLLEKKYGFPKVFLTNSCSVALEMAAILAQTGPGDEVIVPSYTYVSTANAFALRGADIVFADSRADHPNMDEEQLEQKISPRTKAICVVHYAGVACNMDAIMRIARKHGLIVIEDAAQCIGSYYKEQPLGAIGDIACFSFHETKNIHCGEGGFMVINNPALAERAEMMRNKGTNRSAFMRGEANRYEWTDLGFSSIPSAISAAFLYAQLRSVDRVLKKRLQLWNAYYSRLSVLQDTRIQLPAIPADASNNAHIFYLVCKTGKERDRLLSHLQQRGIQAVFHYQSLHRSPYYLRHNREQALPAVERYSSCLLRLPLFYSLSLKEVDYICEAVLSFYSKMQE